MTKKDQIPHISIDDFDYCLPDEKIAKYPLEIRDQSKLLIWKNGNIKDDNFYNLSNYIPEESLLIFNNTKVIRARIIFRKESGSRIEIFILDPHSPTDYVNNFQQNKECSWKCVVGNLKKWKSGVLKLDFIKDGINITLFAEKLETKGGYCTIKFSWNNENLIFSDIIESTGNMPIPPYLNRESEESDITRYQTVYSKIKGSVAAPTAGLHFTDNVFDSLKQKGIKVAETTLHVGAGTFQPVKTQLVNDHEMHTEYISFDKAFIDKISDHRENIIAVGTTSIRTIESIYLMGCKIISNQDIDPSNLNIHQWDPYTLEINPAKEEAFKALSDYMEARGIEKINTSTQIIIIPGYKFKVIDGMLTNFHQPRSTLLLLISAFTGLEWKNIYNHALENDYRFLSYGDSNLYLKQ
jgi:S-adenosylmethionine:tRNA ribosyltransferase-isomerase